MVSSSGPSDSAELKSESFVISVFGGGGGGGRSYYARKTEASSTFPLSTLPLIIIIIYYYYFIRRGDWIRARATTTATLQLPPNTYHIIRRGPPTHLLTFRRCSHGVCIHPFILKLFELVIQSNTYNFTIMAIVAVLLIATFRYSISLVLAQYFWWSGPHIPHCTLQLLECNTSLPTFRFYSSPILDGWHRRQHYAKCVYYTHSVYCVIYTEPSSSSAYSLDGKLTRKEMRWFKNKVLWWKVWRN